MLIQRILGVVLFSATAFSAHVDLPPVPQPTTSFGAAVAEGWLYIYGGNRGKAHEFHRDSINGEFFRVQLPDGKAWEVQPGDTPLLGSTLTEYKGSLYRIGGLEARNAKGEKNDLHSSPKAVRYNPGEQRWEALPDLPEPRSSHDAAMLGDTLYVAGGWKLMGHRDGAESDGDWHKTLLTLDLSAPEPSWKELPQPFMRRALAVVAHGGRLWFLGGMDNNDEPSRAVDWLDPKSGEWGKGPELPEGAMAGFGMAACSANGELLASPLSGKVFALSADGSSWEERTKLARPRFFHRLLVTADGRVVAVGGSDRKGQIRELEYLSIKKPAEPASTDIKPPTEPGSTARWPQWRGPQRDGVSPESGWRKNWPQDGPPVIWRAQVGVGMSSCVVSGGRLITQGNDGKGTDSVIALDAATGAELWRHSFPCVTSPHEMPIVPTGPGATPTLAGASVFALSREGDLVCLDAASGQLAWRKHLVSDLGGKRPVYGYSQSPLLEGGRIFLDIGSGAGETGSTAALDAATGVVIWTAGKGEAGYASARTFTRNGQQLVAMFKGEALDVFDPADGRVLWSHRTTSRDFCNAATPAFVDHRVLVSNTGTDQAALLDWELATEPNVRPAWTHKQFALLFNSAIAYDGCLFGFNEKRRGHHEFTCIDAQTGETRWVSDAVPTSTFILADNHWLFFTRDGEVIVAPAARSGLEPVARFKALEGKCYATPTLADGRLFVRSNTGEIAAFNLR